ncbi:hypothetical protein PROFUN_00903 [Planoprotostelium fungivorum]|uniref:Cytochrome b5 heme-binding domain-containing protein n=1 Tax=Planoprotostelium fungivorum TaxID=1890364 RepID=A0A2P6P0D0_9EUKA|nr:hypothetical protein PROFUN_00903 [Planoprotostelium fungivorum]
MKFIFPGTFGFRNNYISRTSSMSKTFSLQEISSHNTEKDCWVVVDGNIYDVTSFLPEHPGGKKVVIAQSGKDASEKFHSLHGPEVLKEWGPKLLIGQVSGSSSQQKEQKPKQEAPKQKVETPRAPPSSGHGQLVAIRHPKFGLQVPYGDPAWYSGAPTAYYNESHVRFRAAMRAFVDKEIAPNCHKWDEDKQIPREMFRKCYEAGWLPGTVGQWPVQYAGTSIAGGVKPEEWNHFHELILLDELSRAGSGGVVWGLQAGLSIGLPPVLLFGSKYLQDKCVAPCLKGEKIICLCITEPYAGSDVASLRCEAKKSEDGKHYIVNGEKKWITNGVFADFFTVAVRTGGKGMGGISMMLLEKDMPGITCRQMKCSGVWPSGTTYITFEDVKVPVENLIGKENEGFKYVMYNFNHERWGIVCQASRFARVCYEESFLYAHKRRAFGQRLIDQPVVRNKLAHMARLVEATHNWLEQVTYQMDTLSHSEAISTLGGTTALLKAQCTATFELCAREAVQIFGGLGYTRGGQGEKVERLYREVRAYSIPGGSEEIMLDLGVRQAMKNYSAASKARGVAAAAIAFVFPPLLFLKLEKGGILAPKKIVAAIVLVIGIIIMGEGSESQKEIPSQLDKTSASECTIGLPPKGTRRPVPVGRIARSRDFENPPNGSIFTVVNVTNTLNCRRRRTYANHFLLSTQRNKPTTASQPQRPWNILTWIFTETQTRTHGLRSLLVNTWAYILFGTSLRAKLFTAPPTVTRSTLETSI